jgi:predicted CXXCH cytochrome family protein
LFEDFPKERQEPPGFFVLCASGCHAQKLGEMLEKNRVHWPLVEGEACLTCHNPHAAKESGLLKANMLATCGACHADTPDPVSYWKSVEIDQAKMIERIAGKQQVSLRGPNVDLTLLSVLIRRVTMSFSSSIVSALIFVIMSYTP